MAEDVAVQALVECGHASSGACSTCNFANFFTRTSHCLSPVCVGGHGGLWRLGLCSRAHGGSEVNCD